MHTARIPPVDPAPATITAVLAMHAGHMGPPPPHALERLADRTVCFNDHYRSRR